MKRASGRAVPGYASAGYGRRPGVAGGDLYRTPPMGRGAGGDPEPSSARRLPVIFRALLFQLKMCVYYMIVLGALIAMVIAVLRSMHAMPR